MELSYYLSVILPTDFAPHDSCWIACRGVSALCKVRLDQFHTVCAEIATAIADFELVTVLCSPDSLAEASIRCGSSVAALPMPHSVAWMRDCGLSFVVTTEGALQGLYPEGIDDGGAAASPDAGASLTMARNARNSL